MELTRESPLVYQGFNDYQGLCHARVYEQPDQLPVVVVGQLEDSPGPSISNAIEAVAAAVQSTFFPDGREFRLIEYHIRPSSWPHFVEVTFAHCTLQDDPDEPGRHIGRTLIRADRGSAKGAGFRDPNFQAVKDICKLVGHEVQEWPVGEYSAGAIFGDDGAGVCAAVAQHDHQAAARLGALFEPDESTAT